jgi:CubicO group peptidase (beta-lactamase class C family)
MHRRAFGLGVAAASFATAAEAVTERRQAGPLIAAAVQPLVTGQRTAGLVIGVRVAQGAPFVRAWGLANLETSTPAAPASVFRIASCTKQFTAAAVMKLVERGAIQPETPIAQVFGAFPNVSDGSSVTIYHLLTHTSGIRDYLAGGMPADAGDWPHAPNRERIIARMSPLFDFTPGSAWAYSNTNYALLGALIEKVSGQSYDEFLTRNVLQPAGLRDTVLDHYADVVPRRASGYALDGAAVGAFRNAPQNGLPVAEGGLRSTVTDLLRWNEMLFAGRVTSEASLARMTAPATLANGAPVRSHHFFPPGGQANVPPAFVETSDYGFGLEVSRMLGRPVIWHSGGIPGFNAITMHWPEAQLDIVLLSNTDNGLTSAFEGVVRAAVAAH